MANKASPRHTPGPLSVVPRGGGQFNIESDTKGSALDFEDAYVNFGGYFGAYGSHMFAAAPKLLSAAQRLAARGFFNPSACADKATLKDMQSMLDAIAQATGATK